MKNKRKIIKIEEDKCDGCGLCIPNCPEGALQVIDGKARLVSDLLCDGLGACLGECPRGAIVIEEREAVPYDERKVMENMVKKGGNTVKAHLKHLKDHGQNDLLKQAQAYLKEKGVTWGGKESRKASPGSCKSQVTSHKPETKGKTPCGCPGAREMTFGGEAGDEACDAVESAPVRSQLRQWPVQLHLVSPQAPYFKNADVVLAADCAAYSYGNFHAEFLKGRALAIACPKLDEGREIYIEKIRSLIDDAQVSTLTVVTMEVPCCSGLLGLVRSALSVSKRKVPVTHVVIGIHGEIISSD